MDNEKVFAMSFAKIYPMLIAKAERKGRTKREVLEVTAWLTGYTYDQIEVLLNCDTTYGDFFRQAPALNPNRTLIKGSICGIKVEQIEDPLMQNIRYLDKLVDELAKGKAMEKNLEKMNELLKLIDHTIELEEQFLPKFPAGTSQHSLLQNRIQALQTARNLISGASQPSREELEFALPRIESIIRKMSKARDKYEPGSRNYKRFDPTVQVMEQVRTAILQVLEV